MTQTKKFKNRIAVVGPHSLLKAFAEELNNVGYSQDKINELKKDHTSLITKWNEHNNTYGFCLDPKGRNIEKDLIFYFPDGWNQALEKAKELEEELPVYKSGDWIIMTENYGFILKKGQIFKLVKPHSSRKIHWVVDHKEITGCSKNYLAPDSRDEFRHATRGEIEAHLRCEAKRKGFVDGAYFKGSSGAMAGIGTKIEESKIDFMFIDSNIGLYHGNSWIYHNEHGWGTIDKPHPTINLAGFVGEFTEKGIKFGCSFIHKSDISRWYNALGANREDTDITIEGVGIRKGAHSALLTLKQIEEIANYYNII